MTIWIIEPRDPLIVRDGKPFGLTPGARATSLPFPFPSTTTGGVRTRAGLNANNVFDVPFDKLKDLKKLGVRGPLLVQLTSDGNDIAPNKWLVPAPLDALLFPMDQPTQSKNKEALVQQLVPLERLEHAYTDFDQKKLLLVGQSMYNQRKPFKDAPRYWNWNTFQSWLINPSILNGKVISLPELGQHGPLREQRMHVSIEADKETAKEGMLFGTSGLEFTSPGKDEHRLKDAKRLALAVSVDDNSDFTLREGLASLGSERRIVNWRKSSAHLPKCPTELEQAIIEKKACRVLLLTPAYFQEGYYPTWLMTERDGVTPKLRAIAIQRPEVVSGWDLALNKPKPTRRLAPAGTVLFLLLEGSDTAIRDWIKGIWMQCISDNLQDNDPQDRLDGFGLAVLGIWSGQPEEMQ